MAANGKRTLEIVIAGNARGGEKAMRAIGTAAGGMGKAFVAVGAAAGAAAIAVGAAALKFGNDFNNARNSIAVATGATGENLDGLYTDFKDTLGQVPDDMATVSEAIGIANTLFGATGDELSGLTTQVLDFSRLAGGEAARNTEALGQVSTIFGLSASEAADSLDTLFKVTQDTNIGGDKLLNMMQRFGPVFSNAGFGMEETANIVGNLHAAGVDLTRVGPALNAFFRRTAEAGKEPQAALAETEEAIRNAESASEALTIATGAFGAEGAQRMVSAIRDGNVQLTGLGDLLGDNAGLLGETADATASMGEKWNEFKNKILVALEPHITKFFNIFMRGMDWMSDNAIPVVQRIIDIFGTSGLSGVVAHLGDKFRAAWPSIRSALISAKDGFITWVQEVSIPLLQALGDLGLAIGQWVLDQAPIWADQLVEWGKAFVDWLGPQIPPALAALAEFAETAANWVIDTGLPMLVEKLAEWGAAFIEWVIPMIPPLLRELGGALVALGVWIATDAAPRLLSMLWEWTQSFVTWAKDDLWPILKPAIGEMLTDLGSWIKDDAAPAILTKLGEWTSTFVGWVGELPGKLAEAGAGLFDWIKTSFLDSLNWLIGKWNSLEFSFGGFKGVGAFTVGTPDIPPIQLHSGGTFLPAGGASEGLAFLRRGEKVTTPSSAATVAPAGTTRPINIYLDSQIFATALERHTLEKGPLNIKVLGVTS